jgi:large subunit ribosomal protein L14
MLQMESIVSVADNTGAQKGSVIRRLGQLARFVRVGDVFIGSVKESTPEATVKKGDVVRAVLVRTKYPIARKDGSRLRFDDNACVIIDDAKNPKGTRVFGPISREVRQKGFVKIASLASEVL